MQLVAVDLATPSLHQPKKRVRLSHHFVSSLNQISISSVPTGPPTSVTNGTITSNSITVQWEEVACLDRNGEITGYTARAITSGRVEGTAIVSGDVRQATITGLTPSTQYIVQVAVVNSAGSGPFSPIATFTTDGTYLLCHILPHYTTSHDL